MEITKSKISIARLVIWSFCGLVLIVTISLIFDVFSQISQYTLSQVVSEIFFSLFPLIFCILALLIINRQPANIVGWLMFLIAVGGMLTLVSENYFQDMVAPPVTPLPIFWIMLFTMNVSWVLFLIPLILIPLFFPTGFPPSKRWNWVVYLAGGLFIFLFFTTVFGTEVGIGDAGWVVQNPIGILPVEKFENVVNVIWIVSLGVLILSCMAAIIVRYRRGTKLEQAQIKWVVYSSLFFNINYVLLIATAITFNKNGSSLFLSNLIDLLLAVSLLLIPAGISIAILRYRLWDIDFVINRSLVYGALTIFLIALFGSSLYIINGLFHLSGSSLIAVTISAAIFGSIFQPARRNLQRFVDQRFYNIQIDYNKTPIPTSTNTTNVLKQTQFGEYQNLELIGRGGMAEIYKSTHPTLGSPVAIKVLPANLAMDSDFRKRFEREAQTVAKLQHLNIVRLFDYGETNGTYYIVMEYINGHDLSQFLRLKTRFSLRDALPIIRQIASALDHAHSQGIIHRDIKPSNVMLEQTSDSQPRAILMDFGIAKILQANTVITHTGGMLGTFDYVAPEQIQAAANVDGRADIYALGVMTYQMLSGELPFNHQNIGALLIAHMNQPAPDISEILPELRNTSDAIQKAMAKKPEERYLTAMDFATGISETETYPG